VPITPDPLADAVTRLLDAATDARTGGLPSLAATLADVALTLRALTPAAPAEADADPLARTLAWVASHPDPIERARLLGALVERGNAPTLAAARAKALAEAVQASNRGQVAAELGLNPKTITNIVSAYGAHGPAAAPPE
jgi:hypothetical protein